MHHQLTDCVSACCMRALASAWPAVRPATGVPERTRAQARAGYPHAEARRGRCRCWCCHSVLQSTKRCPMPAVPHASGAPCQWCAVHLCLALVHVPACGCSPSCLGLCLLGGFVAFVFALLAFAWHSHNKTKRLGNASMSMSPARQRTCTRTPHAATPHAAGVHFSRGGQ